MTFLVGLAGFAGVSAVGGASVNFAFLPIAGGVLGPLILTGIGLGMVIEPSINTGTFGVAPQDAGVASATVTVGQQLGASIGTSLLNTIFASAGDGVPASPRRPSYQLALYPRAGLPGQMTANSSLSVTNSLLKNKQPKAGMPFPRRARPETPGAGGAAEVRYPRLAKVLASEHKNYVGV